MTKGQQENIIEGLRRVTEVPAETSLQVNSGEFNKLKSKNVPSLILPKHPLLLLILILIINSTYHTKICIFPCLYHSLENSTKCRDFVPSKKRAGQYLVYPLGSPFNLD